MPRMINFEISNDEWNYYQTEFEGLLNELRQTNERIARNRQDTDEWKQEMQMLKNEGARIKEEDRQLTSKIREMLFNLGARAKC